MTNKTTRKPRGKAMRPPVDRQRIEDWVTAAGFDSLRQLAEVLEWQHTKLIRALSGEHGLEPHEVAKLADAVGVPWAEMMHALGARHDWGARRKTGRN